MFHTATSQARNAGSSGDRKPRVEQPPALSALSRAIQRLVKRVSGVTIVTYLSTQTNWYCPEAATAGKNPEGPMNHSMYSADRRTHLKIVVIGLLCATIVAAVGIFGRFSDVDLSTAPLVKAGQPMAVSGRLLAVH
jgi:hypothetical protein